MVAPPKAPPPIRTTMNPSSDAIGELRRQRTHAFSAENQTINWETDAQVAVTHEQMYKFRELFDAQAPGLIANILGTCFL